jgi:hypothetical protein
MKEVLFSLVTICTASHPCDEALRLSPNYTLKKCRSLIKDNQDHKSFCVPTATKEGEHSFGFEAPLGLTCTAPEGK